ncbi:hypothetical protein E2C01_031827 [Portunus trituberculatus]|uniref:Uncharacterized protein n=1 Tax=Portunus trituberculatus TaxID=210409 RepID=A0A5B7EVS6_PORTR|nr:hypothetical protein [Portunus trituberculatus]
MWESVGDEPCGAPTLPQPCSSKLRDSNILKRASGLGETWEVVTPNSAWPRRPCGWKVKGEIRKGNAGGCLRVWPCLLRTWVWSLASDAVEACHTHTDNMSYARTQRWSR